MTTITTTPPGTDVRRIKVDLVALEKAREGCKDSGLLRLLDGWIREAQKKLYVVGQ